jgi:hypothetical protein
MSYRPGMILVHLEHAVQHRARVHVLLQPRHLGVVDEGLDDGVLGDGGRVFLEVVETIADAASDEVVHPLGVELLLCHVSQDLEERVLDLRQGFHGDVVEAHGHEGRRVDVQPRPDAGGGFQDQADEWIGIRVMATNVLALKLPEPVSQAESRHPGV